MRMSSQKLRLPQHKPLAVCLAAALALGISGAVRSAEDAKSIGHGGAPAQHQRTVPTQPSDLPRGSRKRAAWEHARENQPPPRPASTITVSNCNDSGSGSFRDAAAAAVNGDEIDLSHLSCSEITLTSGAVTINAANVLVIGPGMHSLSIDAGNHSSVIYDFSAGYLLVQGVTVTDALYDGYLTPYGGCIYSNGSVTIAAAAVTYCKISPSQITEADSLGGAIFTVGETTLANGSSVSFGYAYNPTGTSKGGAIFSGSSFGMMSSLVSNSYATSGVFQSFAGGVVVAAGGVTIENSAIVDNYSDHNVGGIAIFYNPGYYIGITNSTISQNVAGNVIGGIYSASPLHCNNSTIAFNSEASVGVLSTYGYEVAAGIDVYYTSLTMRSCILSNNVERQYGHLIDLAGYHGSATGTNNLVTAPYFSVPGDTIFNDPELEPLAFNGGPTPTHALSPGSPAIDRGNNSAGTQYDQRGPGFPRVVGANADIGAYETGSDVIFVNGFDLPE